MIEIENLLIKCTTVKPLLKYITSRVIDAALKFTGKKNQGKILVNSAKEIFAGGIRFVSGMKYLETNGAFVPGGKID